MSNNIKAYFDKLYIGNTEFDPNSNVNITGSVSISNNLIVGIGSYISFNGSNNVSLYGIKDDNGTLKYKNSTGEWRYFSTIINGYINFPNENGVYPDNNLVLQEAGFGLRDNNGVLEFKNRTGTANTIWTTIGTDQIVPTTINTLTCNADYDFSNFKLTNVKDPTSNQDASTKKYTDDKFNLVVVPTTINTLTCNADYNFSNFKLLNVGDATLLTDGINKKYVDQTVFNSINTYLINNSIQIQKLLFSGDGTTFLSSDGTFKISSGGSGGSGSITSDAKFNTKGGSLALASLTTGTYNSAFGYNALQYNTTGSYNSAIGGYYLLYSNTTGSSNVAIGGYSTLYSNTTGYQNVAIGTSSLVQCTTQYHNTAIGYFSGGYNTYNHCSFLGDNAGLSYNATGHYQIWLGNSNNYVYGGNYNTISDVRDKALIRDTILGLDFINKVKPVDYKWNYREDYVINKQVEKTRIIKEIIKEIVIDSETGEQKEVEREIEKEEKYLDNELERLVNDGSKIRNRYHHGVIAQDIQQIIQESGIDFGGYQNHTVNGGSEQMTIGYVEFIGPMIKAIQELSQLNINLQNKNNVLESKYNDLLSRIINIENRLPLNNN